MRILLLVCLCALLAACNFVRGVGQDMAAVGRTLTKVSGTQSGHAGEYSQAESQPFDDPYPDNQAYAEPSGMPQ